MDLLPDQVAQIEESLSYTFTNKELLEQSLTHPSYLLNARNQLMNNQRLEFLGDSVIQLALTETLFTRFPQEREGPLTSKRASYARGDYMAGIARTLKLNQYLLLKDKDNQTGIAERDSVLGDAFEALIGAIYLDSDWETAKKIILNLYNNLEHSNGDNVETANPKGKLQELIQPVHGNDCIEYVTTAEIGEPHNRTFEVIVNFKKEALGKGTGRTKKEAAENAAREAIAVYQSRK
ncbi:ribonuclease III [Puniceicoccaceae bacterium K14]|nr:ribonuclease III [Puniceicoccaceae bacterium K14]